MKHIHSHYFLEPELNETDFISLTLKPRSKSRTKKPAPSGWVALTIEPTGHHQLTLYAELAPDAPPDHEGVNYGVRAYYGVLPPGGAKGEAAAGIKRELLTTPSSGEQLPHSVFFRGRKHVFVFDEEDSGKTCFFNARYENAKGQSGPWSTMTSAFIP